MVHTADFCGHFTAALLLNADLEERSQCRKEGQGGSCHFDCYLSCYPTSWHLPFLAVRTIDFHCEFTDYKDGRKEDSDLLKSAVQISTYRATL
ncbi:hypothetical protein Y1Q_0009173 [Alligator mississippiensis]|uniref:Uncharacterized protein n=1 Tax=Alligator mississippiensis TaxID=8496 RepID=A0A151M2Q6_ALLMI|nr:hypothetical protein Y1Q_0009173 [Alligator mississippiensis]